MRSCFLLAFLLGCDDTLKLNTGEGGGGGGEEGGGGGEEGGGTIPDDASGWCAVQAIFQAQCVSCHGSAALGGLNLADDPHARVVNQPSANYAGWTLVVPDDPSASLLYLKVSNAQPEGTGTEMPPGTGGLSGDSLAAIEAWINDGAPSTCDDTDTGGGTIGEGFHAAGYGDPAIHGEEAKFQVLECVECHGDDLEGSEDGAIPSCDSCHDAVDPGWRTNCTFCHGGEDNSTGAPPVQLFGEASFYPHTVHVEESAKKVALACTQCHTKPTDVLSLGHIFLGDDSPGQAEVTFSAGLSPATTWDGLECSNSYCHGNGRGNNGTIAHTAGPRGCSDCHATNGNGMSGWHEDHIDEEVPCSSCHSDTVSTEGGGDSIIKDKALHVNGSVDVNLPSGMSFNDANNTCNGECHSPDDGDEIIHTGCDWDGGSDDCADDD